MMSMKGPRFQLLVLQFLDASRAYPHAEVLLDDFYVETVPEMGLPEDTCLLGETLDRLLNLLYHFFEHDFKQGIFSTCVFAHLSKFLLCFVHGDDYAGSECVVTWKATKRNCLKDSSSRIEELGVPTACMRSEF